MTVQRFTGKASACPVCGGHSGIAKGKGLRCWGFLGSDGKYAHCTNDGHAGALPIADDGTYAHRLQGSCKCGTVHGEAGAPIARREPDKTKPWWQPIVPVPLDAPEPDLRNWQHGYAVDHWRIEDEAGRLLGLEVRYRTDDGGKINLPLTYCEDANPNTAKGRDWRCKGLPSPRPLYGLPALAAKPDADVLMVEGPKAARIAAERFPDLAVVSCLNGWNGPNHTDLTPLAGRTVIGWPDADDKGPKWTAAAVAGLKLHRARMFRVVQLLDGLPDGWDLADDLPPGLTLDDVRRLIETAPPAAGWGTDEPEPMPVDRWDLTEGGNARRLVARYGRDLRYCAERGWLAWDGRRWAPEDGRLPEAAKAAILELRAAAQAARDKASKLGAPGDSDEAKAAHAWAKTLESHWKGSERAASVKGMCEMACSDPAVRIAGASLDADPWLLTVNNGTIDLRTGQLREHDRADLLTRLAPVDYDPAATCPTWDRFLSRIMGGRADLVEYLQRAVGYSLTGSTREQVFFLLYGTGRNGKSVFMNTIAAMLGDYAKETPTETLMVKPIGAGGASTDVACLAGARLVGANESEDGQRLAEARLKALTGGDPITARHLYREPFTFTPAFKLWLRTNHRPEIRGTDDGIWRRIRLIPFDVTIPESEVDPDLSEKLAAELPGILAWAVRGCMAWLSGGLGYPDAVRNAVDGYRSDMDHLGPFLDQLQIMGPIKAQRLHEAYKDWCGNNDQEPMNPTAFGRRLNERGWGQVKKRDGVHRIPPAGPIGEPAQVAFLRAAEPIPPADEPDAKVAAVADSRPAIPAPVGVTIVREVPDGIWAGPPPASPADLETVTLADGSRAVEI